MIKCELCGKAFKNKAGLAGHKQLIHPDNAPVETSKIMMCILELGKGLDIIIANQGLIIQELVRQEQALLEVLKIDTR